MLIQRLRRRRYHPHMRQMLQEVSLQRAHLVQPIFVRAGTGIKKEIISMPGIYQYSLDQLAPYLESLLEKGVQHLLLFGVPAEKDHKGSSAHGENGVVQSALIYIKQHFPQFFLTADVCFCEYTDHGHCGMLSEKGGCLDVDNDQTLEALGPLAVSLAEAGADMLAPSGMMDGAVGAMRQALDAAGFSSMPLMAYAVKYASSLYGPFRDAAEGAPQFGDRKTYQMDFHNRGEALAEAAMDIQEGADILMVKPGGLYLDVLKSLATKWPEVPFAAYQVSGEYAMLQAALEKGWLAEEAIYESIIAFRRAGAQLIISYFTETIAPKLPA